MKEDALTLNSILTNILNAYGNEVIDTYRRKLAEQNINASGRLGNSLSCFVKTEDGIYELYLSLEDYWKYVEYGREPGSFPNIDAIRRWIQIKPVIPYTYNGKLPTTEQLTFLISRKIANEGIPPKNILGDTLQNLDLSILNQGVTKDVENRLDLILTEL